MTSRLTTAMLVTAGLALAACSDAQSDRIAFEGGGFIFNYRAGEAFAGVVVKPRAPLPEDAMVEATFENPAGGADIIVRAPVRPGARKYSLQTPPLTGIVKDHDYRVRIALVGATGTTLETHERHLRSQLDQSVLPAVPLTVGPGYQPNPQFMQGRKDG